MFRRKKFEIQNPKQIQSTNVRNVSRLIFPVRVLLFRLMFSQKVGFSMSAPGGPALAAGSFGDAYPLGHRRLAPRRSANPCRGCPLPPLRGSARGRTGSEGTVPQTASAIFASSCADFLQKVAKDGKGCGMRVAGCGMRQPLRGRESFSLRRAGRSRVPRGYREKDSRPPPVRLDGQP